MVERSIGIEILDGIREIRVFKEGKIVLRTQELQDTSQLDGFMNVPKGIMKMPTTRVKRKSR